MNKVNPIESVQVPEKEDKQVEINPAHPYAPGDWRKWNPTLKDRALSVLSWGAASTWLFGYTSLLNPLNHFLGPDNEFVDRVTRLFCHGMVKTSATRLTSWIHPDVCKEEQYIFVQNHVNHFDFVTMYPRTPHIKQGLELETHFKYPVYGRFMRIRGTIPVPADRENRFPVVLERIRKEMKEKHHSIIAFPEGTRTLNGRVGLFRKGIFVIARELGVKVVPVSVCGMYEVMRKGSVYIRPFGNVEVYLDAPVDFAGLSDSEFPKKIEEVRNTMVARVDAYAKARHG